MEFKLLYVKYKELENAVIEYRNLVDYRWGDIASHQPFRTHGIQHQDDSECGGCCSGLRLVASSCWVMDQCQQFQGFSMTTSAKVECWSNGETGLGHMTLFGRNCTEIEQSLYV